MAKTAKGEKCENQELQTCGDTPIWVIEFYIEIGQYIISKKPEVKLRGDHMTTCLFLGKHFVDYYTIGRSEIMSLNTDYGSLKY